MSSRLPFGNNTLVIPFKFVGGSGRARGSGGMSRNDDARALYRHGVMPPEGPLDSARRSYAPVPTQAAWAGSMLSDEPVPRDRAGQP